MKTMGIFLIFMFFSFSHSDSEDKRFQGEVVGIKSDGKSVFALIKYPRYEKLQIVHPVLKTTHPLPQHRSFHRYFEIVDNKILLLFDNVILVYNTNLEFLKKLKLPDVDTEYHFNYSLNQKKEEIIIMGGNKKCYLLRNLSIEEIRDELFAGGIKIGLKNNIVLINDKPTDVVLKKGNSREIKYKHFCSLIHFLYVLDETRLLFRNYFVENSGKQLATLPFTFEITQAIIEKNCYILFSTENILVVNRDGDIIKHIDVNEAGLLGYRDQGQAILEISQQYLCLLSLTTFELIKKDLGEKIFSAVVVNNELFYITETDRKIIKSFSVNDFFRK